jgi:nitrite reductase (NO-forming)
MNKPIIAGLAAGVLLAGLMLAAPFSGNFGLDSATAQSTGKTKQVTLIADEADVQIAPDNALHPGGVMYTAMVFNGTTPGPVIAVDQGDTIEFTLINEGELVHSVDFHAGYGPNAAVGANSSATGANVQSGERVTWTWQPPFAGVFYYHCGADGLNGVWEHIANGMYGGIVVHPVNEQPAKEFYVVFGEIYSNNVDGVFTSANGTGTWDVAQFLTGNPDIVMTNGMAHKYVPQVGAIAKIPLNPDAEVFQVKPGELTRWYIVNGGPNDYIAFHFISGMMDVKDGSIKNRYGTQLRNDETWTIPPGSGSVIEATFPEEGIYVGVDHGMNDVLKGAAFAVLATQNATDDDHPVGTWVPPRGSELVSSPSMMNETGGANATGAAANATAATTASENQTLPLTNATGAGNVTGAANATTIGNATTTTGNMTGGNMTGGNVTGGNVTSNATTGAMPGNTTTSTGPTPPTPAPTSGTGGGGGNSVEVSIPQGSSTLSEGAYDPNPVQVSAGGTVTWINDDAQPHTATSGENAAPDGKFDSGILAARKSFSYTFAEAGEYPYYCMLHPNMVGTVSVT